PGVRSFAQQALRTLATAHDSIILNRTRQAYEANKHRRGEHAPDFMEGEYVYLSSENFSIPKDRARKLVPKWIGPYKITK
ncbi:hypothetical protein PENSPDRAFT_539355, partial [Peniophora sp. CONT]